LLLASKSLSEKVIVVAALAALERLKLLLPTVFGEAKNIDVKNVA
jgi:hypothetical protein